MTEGRQKVILIVGTGRSGSTLLSNALGSAPGVFSAGEIRFALERGLVQDGFCGCRLPVRSCPVWIGVFEQAFGHVPTRPEAADLHARLRSATRLRTLPRYLRHRAAESDRELAREIGAIHRAIGVITGDGVVVDSSKLPTYAALLRLDPQLDISVVHLVRDPRATAFSWQRAQASWQEKGFEEPMDRFSPVKSTLLWSIWNGAVPALLGSDSVHTVRYEDLVMSPETTLRAVLVQAGIEGAVLPFDQEGLFHMTMSHSIAGNPNRMRYGPTAFSNDSEWLSGLRQSARIAATVISSPVRGRFGYR